MKHQFKTALLASVIGAAMCLALSGCSRGPKGELAVSNTSATNSNSAGQPDSAAAPSSDQAASAAGGASDASKTDPVAGGDPLAKAAAGKQDPLAGGAAQAGNPQPLEQKPPPPRTYTIAAGRPISIFTTSTLSTKTNRAGDSFTGTLSSAIVDGDWVVAKRGAAVQGVITGSDPGGKVKGVASLTLVVKRLQLADGRNVEVSTSSFTKAAKTTKKKDALKIGGGAAVGAVIGGIVGGKKGAAVGAGVGGGAGTGVVLATRGDPATIPAETSLTFRLRAPVTIVKQ